MIPAISIELTTYVFVRTCPYVASLLSNTHQ
jgi:hypothetical protein